MSDIFGLIMDKQGTNILDGEASESDDEEFADNQSNSNQIDKNPKSSTVESQKTTLTEGPISSVVVSGEASESDDDDETATKMMLTRNFPTLISQQGLKDDFDEEEDCTVTIQEQKQKFESPFHRGIYERNFSLRLGIVRQKLEEYENINNKLKNFVPFGNRAQNHAQETLKNYRSIGENCKQIDDNLEHLLRHADLPRLKTPFPVT